MFYFNQKSHIILGTSGKNKSSKGAGFTLIEVLIYIAILTIIVGAIITIFVTTVRISNRETSSAEVTSQINYVSQTISRLVRESSLIDIAANNPTSTLKLRMSASSTDPTCITFASGAVLIAQGPNSQENCSSTSTPLTTAKVTVDDLTFTKITSYPGHDTLTFTISITASTTNSQNRTSRTLTSATSRVFAATFDSSLIPGTSNTYSIGQAGTYWTRAILGDGSAASPTYSFSNSTGLGIFRAGADILGFSIAGNEKMRIASSGNVGIGTQNPAYLLDVNGTTNAAPSGAWCGLCGDTSTNVQTCLGNNVCSACPSGWTRQNFSNYLWGSTSSADYVCVKN